MTTNEKVSKLIRSNPVTDNVITRVRLYWEMRWRYKRFLRHFGRLGMNNNESKYSADLRIKVHAIEKGLSLPSPHPGFGEAKVKAILESVDYYKRHFKQMDFLVEIRDILDSYFDFQRTHHHENMQLQLAYDQLFADVKRRGVKLGGTKQVSKKLIDEASAIDYERFVDVRFAVRDFSSEPVDIDLIRGALKIAEKTPSACNRQPWRVYVYRGDMKTEILKWQGGSKGFWDMIDTAILVCCNTESYFMGESCLPYVDGGLYAMNLMYALHSKGLGTIPLTTGLMPNSLEKLYTKFGVQDNEVPILLIGVGNLKDNFEVAMSHRYDYQIYTTFVV